MSNSNIPDVPSVHDHTVTSFSEAAHVSVHTVRSWIRNGTISAYRLGPRLLRIPASELENIKSPAGLNAFRDQ